MTRRRRGDGGMDNKRGGLSDVEEEGERKEGRVKGRKITKWKMRGRAKESNGARK